MRCRSPGELAGARGDWRLRQPVPRDALFAVITASTRSLISALLGTISSEHDSRKMSCASAIAAAGCDSPVPAEAVAAPPVAIVQSRPATAPAEFVVLPPADGLVV